MYVKGHQDERKEMEEEKNIFSLNKTKIKNIETKAI